MVKMTQTLDWVSSNIFLLWRAPKTVKKPATIYTTLWGLIQTINTTSIELEEQLAQCTDHRRRNIIANTLAEKRAIYPSDDFPLIAFHPTKGSYHQNGLIPNQPIQITIVFGGEHIHLAQQWLDWFKKRLTLENTGFVLLPPVNLIHHQVKLPDINEIEQRFSQISPSAERTFLLDMPANFLSTHKKETVSQMQYLSKVEQLTKLFLINTKKRFTQWFPTQQDFFACYFATLETLLQNQPFCTYQLHETIDIKTQSKSTRTAQKQMQYHQGMAGWLTVKGAWSILDEFWQILESIHLLGQRAKINGLGYIIDEKKLNHQPQSLMQRYFTQEKYIKRAVNDVLQHYDLEPEWDEKGKLMEESTLTQWLYEHLNQQDYMPQVTTAFEIEKPHGGTRRIEQLSQHDMIVHRLVFNHLAPLIDQYQSPLSLGYRKGYSREMARDKINQLMKSGFTWVIEADIEDFFNSIPLKCVWQQLSTILPQREQAMIDLIAQLMQVPYVYANQKKNINTPLKMREKGLMQGSPLSPTLANLYLSQLDDRLQHSALAEHICFIRYADDVLIFCRQATHAEQTLQNLDLALAEIGLNLSISKTAMTKVSDGFEFLGYRFDPEGSEDKSIVPILKQRKPLILTGTRKYVGVNGSALEIRERKLKQTKKSKKTQHHVETEKGSTLLTAPTQMQQQVIQVIPLRRISQLIIMGNHALSSPLLSACAKEKVSVHFVNEWGFQVGTMTPINAFYFSICAKQYTRHQQLKPSNRLMIAADIVQAKINNYQTWIINSYRKGDHVIQEKLNRIREQINTATHISQVMGYEGAAAKLCFERLQNCFIDDQKSVFKSYRRSRGGKDRLNSLLNFGYYWLFTRISALVRSHGLNPFLSFLHESEQNYETLVYDIMELFRVHVDKTVLRLINRKQIQERDFHLNEKKGWLLNNNALHLFTNQLQATFTSEINKTVLEDILLMQIRTIQNWAIDGSSLIWFYWYADKNNQQFLAHDDNRIPMTIDHIPPVMENQDE